LKNITTTFFKGLFTLLPLLLSIYVMIWFIRKVEGWSSSVILTVWPDSLYVSGMGVVISFVIIYIFGSVIDQPLAKWFLNVVDRGFSQVPGIKTIYLAIKDFTDYLRPGNNKPNQVVLVKFPNSSVEIIGLLTRETLRGMPEPVTKAGRVAVYFPMSYQFGGYTLFVPREWITPTDLSVEQAMRSVLTAWLPGRDKNLEIHDERVDEKRPAEPAN
jgi:uncharacterized membrane protein